MKRWWIGVKSRLWTFQYVLRKSLKAAWCELVGHNLCASLDGFDYCQRCGKTIPEWHANLKVEKGGRVRYKNKWYKLNERYQPYDGSLDGRKFTFIIHTPTEEDIEETGRTERRLTISNPPSGWGVRTSYAMIAGVKTPVYRTVWNSWEEVKDDTIYPQFDKSKHVKDMDISKLVLVSNDGAIKIYRDHEGVHYVEKSEAKAGEG